MKSRGQNQKITQIISISNNYKLHRNQLQKSKPVVQSFNKKRQKQYQKIATQRLKYRQAIRDFDKTTLDRQNSKIVTRLTQIAQESVNKRYSQMGVHSPQIHQTLNTSRSSKRLKSMSSSKSMTSVCSNFRRRTLRQKQIQRENIKIAKRISNPKSSRTFALQQLNKSYRRQQQIVKTRSRFSHKNQQIIRSLALYGLKFDKKDIQYLPQLSHRKNNSSIKKLNQKSRVQ